MNELAVYLLIAIILLGLASGIICLLNYLACKKINNKDLSDQLIAIDAIIKQIDSSTKNDARALREELRAVLSTQNQQLELRLAALGETFENRFTNFSQIQSDQISNLRKEYSDGREKLEESLKKSTDAFSLRQTQSLSETNLAMKDLSEGLQKAQKELRDSQDKSLINISTTIKDLMESNATKQDAMRESLNTNLELLRKDNEAKLEQIRVTVDEKLQGTLEKRLGESFQIVSDRLEQVHKGLGEMQSLATGVGDLKRVLTNVKSRGGWGEVQLSMLLEDMLTKDQFETNIKIKPDSGEIVEFAIRLPGKEEGFPVYLPIDAKFPHEDYDRLLQSQDIGNIEDIERAAIAVERAIKTQAKTISEKYIHPPYSTDFAIMYLPTEGLFAEVIRRPGLANEIQTKYRVMITGPTTLAAVLSSLQMGFKTLAIEKRSSEVWQVLAAAKVEFRKYGDVWDKLKKQLETAQNTVDEAGKRTRAVEKKLKDVETISIPDSGTTILALPIIEDSEEE